MEAHKQTTEPRPAGICPAGICPSHCPPSASCPARHLPPTASPVVGLHHAIAAVRYWNRNQFDGRFKTMETERAETLLRAAGIDPATVGSPAKGVVAAIAKPKKPLPQR